MAFKPLPNRNGPEEGLLWQSSICVDFKFNLAQAGKKRNACRPVCPDFAMRYTIVSVDTDAGASAMSVTPPESVMALSSGSCSRWSRRRADCWSRLRHRSRCRRATWRRCRRRNWRSRLFHGWLPGRDFRRQQAATGRGPPVCPASDVWGMVHGLFCLFSGVFPCACHGSSRFRRKCL